MKRQTTAKEGMVSRDPWANAILGWTFKEDVPDIRNTRVIDIYHELQSYGVDVSCYGPVADATEVRREYCIELAKAPVGSYEAVILAVKHRVFAQHFSMPYLSRLNHRGMPIVIDVKGCIAAVGQQSAIWQL